MKYKVSKETALLIEAYDVLNREFSSKVYEAIEAIYGDDAVDKILDEDGFNEAREKIEDVLFKFISCSISENRCFLDSDKI